MAQAGQSLESPDGGERVVFRRAAADTRGEELELDFFLRPGRALVAEHVHPRQEETLAVRAGTLSIKLGGETRRIGPGERVRVAPGQPHHVWNEGDSEAHALVRFRPALDTEGLFEELFRLAREGRTIAGKPNPLLLAARLAEHPDEFYLAAVPVGLQKALARALAPVGRALRRR